MVNKEKLSSYSICVIHLISFLRHDCLLWKDIGTREIYEKMANIHNNHSRQYFLCPNDGVV